MIHHFHPVSLLRQEVVREHPIEFPDLVEQCEFCRGVVAQIAARDVPAPVADEISISTNPGPHFTSAVVTAGPYVGARLALGLTIVSVNA